MKELLDIIGYACLSVLTIVLVVFCAFIVTAIMLPLTLIVYIGELFEKKNNTNESEISQN